MSEFPPLQLSDILGRGIFSSRHVQKARKGVIRAEVFQVKSSEDRISVDRMDHADDAELAMIGDRTATGREGRRKFYGWAIVTVEVASQRNRHVEPSPFPDNAYHADIVLGNCPDSEEKRDFVWQHALNLADGASFRDRPDTESSART